MAAALAALLNLAAAPHQAVAGSFEVNSVNLAVKPGQTSTSVLIRNTGSSPVGIRVLTKAWTQSSGDDVHIATDDLIASPPIFTLAPGKTQLVRLGLRQRRPGSAYRVIFDEIPDPQKEKGGIQVALRMDLPLHVLQKNGEAHVDWSAWRTPEGDIYLQGGNSGLRHVQFFEFSTPGVAGERRILSKQMGVILPHGSKTWRLGRHPDLVSGSPLALNIRGPRGEIQTKVVLESR